MGFFGKKKEDSGHIDAMNDIKQVSSLGSQNNNQISNNSTSDTGFVNPFAQDQNTSLDEQNINNVNGVNMNQQSGINNNIPANNPFSNSPIGTDMPQGMNVNDVNMGINDQNSISSNSFNTGSNSINQTPQQPELGVGSSTITNQNQGLNMNNTSAVGVNNNLGVNNGGIDSVENPSVDLNQVKSGLVDEKITRDDVQEMVDETVEKIIEEKWEKLLSSVESVVSWKETQEKEMEEIKSSIVEIMDNFGKLEKKLSDKISTYDSGLLDVNAEIKALEKVFQKITPTLVNNVNNLEKIAMSLKESTHVNVDLNKNTKVDLDE